METPDSGSLTEWQNGDQARHKTARQRRLFRVYEHTQTIKRAEPGGKWGGARAILESMVDAQDPWLTELAEVHARMDGHLARLDDKIGKLTGFMIEKRLRRNAPGYFGRRLNRVKVVLPSELALLREADRQGKVTDDDWLQVNQLDIVVRGFEPNGDGRGHEVLYAIEASSMVDRHDVERAKARSEILARVGYDARPVVGGVVILDNARELAERLKVTVFLNPNLEN